MVGDLLLLRLIRKIIIIYIKIKTPINPMERLVPGMVQKLDVQKPVLHPGQNKSHRPEERGGLGHPQEKGLVEGLIGEFIGSLVSRAISDLEGLDGTGPDIFWPRRPDAGNNGVQRPKPQRSRVYPTTGPGMAITAVPMKKLRAARSVSRKEPDQVRI